MQKILTAIVIATLFTACGGDPPSNPDLCLGVTCGHGTCESATGACKCDENYSGTKCDKLFDPMQFKASKVICASDSGRMEISGETGDYARYNGYYVDIPVGAVDRCVWFVISFAAGTGATLPSPATGEIVKDPHGIEVTAIDKEKPYLPDGTDFNKVQLLKEIGIFFNQHRAKVVLYSDADKAFTLLPTEIKPTGTLGQTKHLSPFYLDNHDPILAVTATHEGNRVVLLDFTGTSDEDSELTDLIRFSASEDGTPLTDSLAGSGGLKFRVNLPDGKNSLTLSVTDRYGKKDSKVVTVTDLCLGVTCQHSWEHCRDLDGVCTGSDPCSPNPCVHGTCRNTTGSPVCACAGGWLGTLCDQVDKCYQVNCSGPSHGSCKPADGSCQCNAGWIGADCGTDDPCLPDPCQNSGTCSLSGTTAVCACTGHWNPATSCATCVPGWEGANCSTQNLCYGVSCPDDGLFCNGTEACNPANGQCIHQNPPNCNHGSCNESTDACVCDQYFGGATCNACASGTIGTYPNCLDDPCLPNPCANSGTCNVVGTSPVCTCTNHWDPATSCTTCTGHWNSATGCTTCVAGWMGIDCNTVDPCAGITCQHGGTCSGGTCTCTGHWSGSTCGICATGWDIATSCTTCLSGYGGANCDPVPTISGFAIDCSSTGGLCGAGGLNYPLSFSVTNATSCSGTAVKISGGGGTPGSVSNCTINGNSGTATYTTGSTGGNTIRITIQVNGTGGTASTYIDVMLE